MPKKALFHKDFKKDLQKLQPSMRRKFEKRFLLLMSDSDLRTLKDHALTGNLKGKRAFSVSGDIRVIYRYVDADTILLLRIGTHNQVY